MTSKQQMVYPAEDAVKISFETKRDSMYMKALEFDKIAPGTPIDLVVFSVANPFAEKWRKMLH
jgi:hypothetical protein